RCKHCGQAMEVRRKAVPVANGAPVVPRALPVESDPGPTWEPLPANEELPEYTPPAAAPGTGPLVTALPAEEKYTGRGRYKGPKNRGWLKYAVLAVFFAGLAAGAVAVAKYRPELFKSATENLQQANNNEGQPGNGENPGTTPGENPPPIPGASGTFPRRMLAISIHSYLYANPLHNGESTDETKRTGTDAAINELAARWRVPKEQLYHLTDARLWEERRKPEPKPEPKNKPGAKEKAEE